MNTIALSTIFPIQEIALRLPRAGATLLLGLLAIRFCQWLMGKGLQTAKVTQAMQGILHSTASIVLWAVVIALVFQSLGLTQIAIGLSSALAIVGVGFATGGSKVVSDLLAGVLLARSREFNVGGRVKISEVEGVIRSVDTRKVHLIGDDGTIYIIPNTKFDEQIWQTVPSDKKNHKKEPHAR